MSNGNPRLIRSRTERPIVYSENRNTISSKWDGNTDHLTVECLITVCAQILMWDEALAGWLPMEKGELCNVSLLQEITCRQSLSTSIGQRVKCNSWSEVLSQKNLTVPILSKTPQREYSIQGKQLSDQRVILNCSLIPHITYRNAMPTFHHWRINDKRYGLSFNSVFEASKFHNRLHKALDYLIRQYKSSSGESNIDAYGELEDDVFATEKDGQCYTSSIILNPELHISHDFLNRASMEMFMDPPMDPCSARTSFDIPKNLLITAITSLDSHSDITSEVKSKLDSHKVTEQTEDESESKTTSEGSNHRLISSLKTIGKNEISEKMNLFRDKSKSEVLVQDRCVSFVRQKARSASNPVAWNYISKSNRPHLQHYMLGALQLSKTKSMFNTPLRINRDREFIVLPTKKQQPSSEMMRRECCFYCRNWYSVPENRRGCCKEAPDPIQTMIRRLTCYSVAQAAVYHCCNNENDASLKIGRFNQGYNVCGCGPPGTSFMKRARRWLLLSLLSLLVPCLCCYIPANIIYNCCCKGHRGRHKPCTDMKEDDFLFRSRNNRNSRFSARFSL